MTNWQTKKIDDVMDFVPTGAHSRNDMTNATDDPSQVFNIHYGDIHTKYSTYVIFDKDIVPVLKENAVRDSMRLQDGDLVVADASEDYDGVGSSVELRNVSDRKVIGGLHTFALRSKNEEFASGFTGLMLKNPATRKRLMQMSVYSKVYGLTKSGISSVDVSYPEKPEQERIVGVLDVWDEYIEKLEQKIALKEQLKKGLMQQLLTGKRRLPGFKKDWQAVKLGNISRIKTGGKDNQNKITDGLHPFFVRSPQIERINSYCFDGEAILVPGEGNIGKIFHYINGKFDYHQRVYGITHFADNVSGRYIYYFFVKNFARQAEKHSVKATVDSLRLPTFSNFIINLPSLDEQVAIVKVLDGLAEEVKLSEKKLKKINEQKKYLLKNLITGTIRTPEDLQPLDASRLERSAL